jgi:hypothetical protein
LAFRRWEARNSETPRTFSAVGVVRILRGAGASGVGFGMVKSTVLNALLWPVRCCCTSGLSFRSGLIFKITPGFVRVGVGSGRAVLGLRLCPPSPVVIVEQFRQGVAVHLFAFVAFHVLPLHFVDFGLIHDGDAQSGKLLRLGSGQFQASERVGGNF